MKKGIQILLALVMVISILGMSIVGCAKEEAPGAPTRITPQVPAPAAPAPVTPAPVTPAKPAPAPEAEVFDWRLASGWPEAGAIHRVEVVHLANQIEETSMGRIKLRVYAGGVLFPEQESLEAAGEGVCELVCTDGSYARGRLPVGAIESGLPMLYEDTRDIAYCNYELGVREILLREYAKFNVRYLGLVTSAGSGSGLMTVPPIRTLDDFKGVTIRTYGAYLDFFEKVGMGTVFLPHDEVYMALMLGTIEGYCTGRGQQWDYRGHEVCEYYYMPGVGAAAGLAMANMDAWDSLPPDLQQAIWDAVRVHAGWMIYGYDPIYVDVAMKWFDGYGLERIVWGPEIVNALHEAAKEVWDEFAAESPASAEAMNIVTDYLEKKRAGTLLPRD